MSARRVVHLRRPNGSEQPQRVGASQREPAFGFSPLRKRMVADAGHSRKRRELTEKLRRIVARGQRELWCALKLWNGICREGAVHSV